MNLKHKFIVYLTALHVLLLAVSVLVIDKFLWWFFLFEALFLVSLYYGYRLIRRLLEPQEFLRSGTEILKEEEYSVRFCKVGQVEMDRLIEVYNKMLTSLQRERLRLGEQRGFLDELLKATPAGILTFDFDDRISMANPSAAQLLDQAGEALVGRTLADLPGELAAELAALEVGSSRMVSLGGGRRVRCRRSTFQDRGFLRAFVLIEELTEELHRSERSAYEKLIRMMSHEVNNTVGATNSLLNSCRHYAEQLSPDDRADYASALGVVISRNENLNVFMQQFAGIVRLPQPVLQEADIVALLDGVGVLMSGQCRQRRIEWVRKIPDRMIPVQMDQHLMEQVFLNIVKNAIEAIGEDGKITVVVGESLGAVEVSINDTGGALTPEIKEQVFSPFFTTKKEGNGIGLTLVREILTQHGFGFSLDGESDETRFLISLPR